MFFEVQNPNMVGSFIPQLHEILTAIYKTLTAYSGKIDLWHANGKIVHTYIHTMVLKHMSIIIFEGVMSNVQTGHNPLRAQGDELFRFYSVINDVSLAYLKDLPVLPLPI